MRFLFNSDRSSHTFAYRQVSRLWSTGIVGGGDERSSFLNAGSGSVKNFSSIVPYSQMSAEHSA